MADFNKNSVYNQSKNNGGFFWNGAKYVELINLYDDVFVSDTIKLNSVKLILAEVLFSKENLFQTISIGINETVNANDDMSFSVLFSILDSFGIQDDFINLVVHQYLQDKTALIEDVKQFVELVANDTIHVDDDVDIEAFLTELDNFNMKDLKSAVEVLIAAHDQFGLTDRAPKKAISDFVIGVASGLDTAYDWLIPFDMKLDWGNTDIQVMPEAELTAIEMPGIDGSIVEDTVYKDRLFTLVTYSEQGMTEIEKETLKSKITSILATTKSQTKKLVVQDRGIAFDVRYEGQANITEGPSYVKAEIPFRTGPYGYDFFEAELEGTGLIENRGDVPIGVKTTIYGPISNPSFTMGAITYRYNGYVSAGSSLVLDHGMLTCYLVSNSGKKTNVLANLSPSNSFQKIPAKSSVVLNANYDVAGRMITTWKNKILW